MKPNISFVVNREIENSVFANGEEIIKDIIARNLARQIIDKIKLEKHPGHSFNTKIYKIELEVIQWLGKD